MQRARYNPTATSDRPRWLKVYDYLGNDLSSRRIDPGTNLVQVIEAEAARWMADGWVVEADAAARERWGNFFMNRCGERRMVAIVPLEVPLAGHSTNGIAPPA